MSRPLRFRVESADARSKARAGRLALPRGEARTPLFMAVGTRAAVKTLTPGDLSAAGCRVILANAYHLSLRPGAGVIAGLGGLHRFMGWDGPILTDSGGYQLFSLAPLARVSDEGIDFQSHIDGVRMMLTPERAVEVQEDLGADIAMALDEPLGFPHARDEARRTLERTTLWAERAKKAHAREDQALFGIAQGGGFEELRARSARELAEMDFPGYAVGGLCLGEAKARTDALLDAATDALPPDRPRYAMGMGTPADLIRGVRRGVDMFDCVMPTRHARRGNLFSWGGRLAIKNASHAEAPGPIDPRCGCEVCRKGYSRAYLRHLFQAGETLGLRLMTIHNLYFYQSLLARARKAIEEGRFSAWAEEQLAGPLGRDPEGPPGGGRGRRDRAGRLASGASAEE